jgi:hypothetical protein
VPTVPPYIPHCLLLRPRRRLELEKPFKTSSNINQSTYDSPPNPTIFISALYYLHLALQRGFYATLQTRERRSDTPKRGCLASHLLRTAPPLMRARFSLRPGFRLHQSPARQMAVGVRTSRRGKTGPGFPELRKHRTSETRLGRQSFIVTTLLCTRILYPYLRI